MNLLDNIYSLWEEILNELSSSVSSAIMTKWIKTLVPVSFDDDCLVLETATEFTKGIVKRFIPQIQTAAENVLGLI